MTVRIHRVGHECAHVLDLPGPARIEERRVQIHACRPSSSSFLVSTSRESSKTTGGACAAPLLDPAEGEDVARAGNRHTLCSPGSRGPCAALDGLWQLEDDFRT